MPAGATIAYCNTGHWAATDWFVLHELLGRKQARLYAGSMVEWTSNASRPLEFGAHQMGRSEEEARPRVPNRSITATSMTTATMAAPNSGAALGIDRLFLGLALIATAILVALVLLDGQPASAALILGGFGLGIAFLKAEFSYTASWRRFLTRGEAGGLLGGLIVIAICALAVVPVAALKQNFGGAIAPLGPSLLIGAFTFGIGMQLANGCGSGTLYTVGGGSGRMLIALLFFVIGSVIGSLSLPAFLALGGIDPVLASDYLGPWGGLAATLVSIALAAGLIVAVAKRRGANYKPSRNYVTRRHRHRTAVRRRVHRRRASLERDLRLHGMGR